VHKDGYLKAAYAELDSIKEWAQTYPIIQDSNNNWVTIGRKPGKDKFDGLHKVADMMQSDPES
jgi:hypothetical protein